MVDILRWGMEEDYPVSVNSVGGRFRYQDDWETPDTQVISMNFADGKSMTWEGRSCNGRTVEGAEVGADVYGEKGSLLITGSNGYTIYDLKNNLVKEEMSGRRSTRTIWLIRPSHSMFITLTTCAMQSVRVRRLMPTSCRGTRAHCSCSWATSPNGSDVR